MEFYESKKKYDKLGAEVVKAMPIIIKSNDKAKVREMMDIIRRYLPKDFFKLIQNITKAKKKSYFVICFKAKVEEDRIVEDMSLEEYMIDLYKDEEKKEWPRIPKGERIEVT